MNENEIEDEDEKEDIPFLKPCPFCGQEPRFLPCKPGFWTLRVICDSCDFYIDSVERWNTRVSNEKDL